MADIATPNLPSRDFEATARFYGALGFAVIWRDAGWMILQRGPLCLEFFPFPDLDPDLNAFGSCLRVDDLSTLYRACIAAGVPEASLGAPRLHPPKQEAWGGLMAALIDPDGTLLRLIQN